MPLIPLDKLHPDPRNANVCSPEILDSLKRNIQRTGICPALLIRPHPKKPKHFILIDGHHRYQIVQELGWTEVECQIAHVNRKDAGLLLLTLNRLRGTDIPRKRAELMESLLPTLGIEELALLVPETQGEIEGLLALLKQDDNALAQTLKAQMDAEKQTLPVPFGFMIPADDAPLVRETLEAYQATTKSDQAHALIAICRDVMALKEGKNGT